MDHALAREVFSEIQSRPYSVSEGPGQPSNSCYFKGIELLQRLGILGYAVRGRVGETYWDPAIIPSSVLNLLPNDLQVTHFFVEVLSDKGWRPVDPSFQPALAKYGFQIGGWDSGNICFPITKLYSQEESIAYQTQWFTPEVQQKFFERGGPCWRALNNWFKENR